MNKNLQYIIAFSTLIIAGSVAYYVFSYLPKTNAQALSVQLQKECLAIGSKKLKEDEESKNEQGATYFQDFVFNKSSNSCMYKTFYSGNAIKEENITDLFSNKIIESYAEDKEKVLIYGNKVDFLRVEKENFK